MTNVVGTVNLLNDLNFEIHRLGQIKNNTVLGLKLKSKKQMDDFGGMVSFNLKGNKLEDAIKLVSTTHYFTLAESLGGVESLIGHPASMTHAAIPKQVREKTGVVDTLIRLSVGVEDIEDLVDDLKMALDSL